MTSKETRTIDGERSFVGRTRDLASVEARFDDGARLVTLVAPGGMGKTRLATRFIARHAQTFAEHGGGGAWFSDLVEATDAKSICRSVGATLGASLERTKDERALVSAMGDSIARLKKVLIVLDNLEHVVGPANLVLRVWLQKAPHARFLVTSRTMLGLPGEHLVPLEPLELPQDATGVLENESVDLFLRRVREVRPSFAPGTDDADALLEVVRATDGIPLAIELAAARARVLSLEQMRERLRSSRDLLVRSGDPGRHGSMRRTILDSLSQLDSSARLAFAACAEFRGGFSLESAEFILDEGEVLTTLESLAARSLLRTHDLEGQVRFSMFEAMREVATAELQAQPELRARVTERHKLHFASMATTLGEQARLTGSRRAWASLLRERDNLVLAHDRLVETTRAAATAEDRLRGVSRALAIAFALEPILSSRGEIETCFGLFDGPLSAGGWESAQDVEAVLSSLPAGPREGPATLDAATIARAVLGRAIARRELGEAERAKLELEVVALIGNRLGDPLLEASAVVQLADIVETSGRTLEARAFCARGLEALARAPANRPLRLREAELRARLGHVNRREGDLAAAALETNRALLLFRETESETELPGVLYEAGVIALFRERYEESEGHFEEGLATARRLGARQTEGALESGTGILCQERGQLDRAIGCHARSVMLFHEIGSRRREGSALYYLGAAFLERGATGEAVMRLAQAREIMRTEMPRYEVLIAGCQAVARASEGDSSAAEALLDDARRAIRACGSEPALKATLDIHALTVESFRSSDRSSVDARASVIALAHPNDDVRFASRLLRRSRVDSSPRPDALVVRADGSAFRLPTGTAFVDLSTRGALRNILIALATLRVESPGEPLSLDEVIRAGWPGERIGDEAAANRVRVALATLRKLGLRQAIVTARGGYLLDPAIVVDIEPAPDPA